MQPRLAELRTPEDALLDAGIVLRRSRPLESGFEILRELARQGD